MDHTAAEHRVRYPTRRGVSRGCSTRDRSEEPSRVGKIYPHLGDYQEAFKDAVILAEVQDAAPIEPSSDAGPGLVEDAEESEGPLDVDAIFDGSDEEPSADDE